MLYSLSSSCLLTASGKIQLRERMLGSDSHVPEGMQGSDGHVPELYGSSVTGFVNDALGCLVSSKIHIT